MIMITHGPRTDVSLFSDQLRFIRDSAISTLLLEVKVTITNFNGTKLFAKSHFHYSFVHNHS